MSLLLPAVEVETGPQPHAAVVWMHGLGADGHDFEGIVPELALPPARPVRFVFPYAPRRPMTIATGQVMRAWYDVRNDAGERREDEPGSAPPSGRSRPSSSASASAGSRPIASC